ncbi:MAG TPA: DUF4383 domain-containing protein [Actinomycetota bacterium]|nr:DUF4383 domain-containing protein [Actinomycetota bacterium]
MDRTETRGERTWPEWVVLAFGITYLAVGALGFAVTSGVGFAAREGDELLGIFEVNPLHNIVHLAIGAALVAGFMGGRRSSGLVAMLIGATYLLVGVIGPFVTDSDANILALNGPDHILHIGSAVVLLFAGYAARRPEAQMSGTARSDMRRAA